MSQTPSFQVLLAHAALIQRTAELADAIAAAHRDELPVLVCVVEGARRFATELVARLPGAPSPQEVRASSYGDGTVSGGTVSIDDGDGIDVDGRAVLLIEDIVDSGRTVRALEEHFSARGATRVETVTLLTKPARRVVDVELSYVGFEIEDRFVVGFGMDYAGRYRELADIVIYDEAIAAP